MRSRSHSPSISATGAYLKLTENLFKVGVLLMDDFAMATLKENELADLAEILEERSQRRPGRNQSVSHGNLVGAPPRAESTVAEAICDRLRHNAYGLNLKGISMRTTRSLPEEEAQK